MNVKLKTAAHTGNNRVHSNTARDMRVYSSCSTHVRV